MSVVMVARISIHAPRTGSDEGATEYYKEMLISIHAPRTGSDIFNSLLDLANDYFNPRSPHGERQENLAGYAKKQEISIHAPRTGSDSCVWSLAG